MSLKKIQIAPTLRISLGLVLVTMSILFTAYLLGLAPDKSHAVLDARKKLAETLAVQYSTLAQKGETDSIRKSMGALVERNDDVLSAALRSMNDSVIAEAGNHERHWVDPPGEQSTPTHALVPIFNGARRWGTVELSFEPVDSGRFLGSFKGSFFWLIVYMTVLGFLGYFFFMRRTLRELDPATVIPPRVKAALDALVEGVVLLDEKEQIVLVNDAFAEHVDETPSSILGRKASDFRWLIPESKKPAQSSHPWVDAMQSREKRTGVQLALDTPSNGMRLFRINGAPILDGRGRCRGALATFDDVTELERKNEQLRETLDMLEQSQEEIQKQNKQLEVLATHDPLTNCLNRRSFMEKLEEEWNKSIRLGQPLACIMVDIDHFKSINDHYGHAAGDQVIKQMAETLCSGFRNDDVICRYGGEEFCVVLPYVTANQAAALAERIRRRIATQDSWGVRLIDDHRVTASLGVTGTEFGAEEPSQMLEQADKALYASKAAGRDRVTRWDNVQSKQAALG
ncbi:MAG: diguanylate cyclase [Gammaproteobacteria bacterium]|nr:diguanylate cyclase [Gammaproteobacteria bacterium]NIR84976.1 diguanylate cyclase [Gammaproteobacteria bacterium]NIR91825.1 diguanylate cyclase [Gammaproteobacteria bacterium]NIU06023.1 diguanylate cyclase [Gammaproteobacteria bacterium]NIV53070.1 diguanylate cyclase [Gammaproteobacteria bacterium]